MLHFSVADMRVKRACAQAVADLQSLAALSAAPTYLNRSEQSTLQHGSATLQALSESPMAPVHCGVVKRLLTLAAIADEVHECGLASQRYL